jgi:hypothetical protein
MCCGEWRSAHLGNRSILGDVAPEFTEFNESVLSFLRNEGREVDDNNTVASH